MTDNSRRSMTAENPPIDPDRHRMGDTTQLDRIMSKLGEIEREVDEFEYWAECRGQDVNAANYRKISKMVRDIREEAGQ